MGASPALRKTIDVLVANKRNFDSATNRDLYVTYVNPRSDGDDFPEQLQSVISSARQFLGTAISDNRTQIDGARRGLLTMSDHQRSPADHRKACERIVECDDACLSP